MSRYNRESEIKQKKCFTEIRERNYLLRGGMKFTMVYFQKRVKYAK